ncbi:MAG: hypothetical protein AAF997_22805 [Myxococcota bacterium]
MAKASRELVIALRQTAARLVVESVPYRWGSFSLCNCGHLAQTVTGLAPGEIESRASRGEGDWATQAWHTEPVRFPSFDYGDRPALDEGAWEPEDVGACQVTGAPLDDVFRSLYRLGLSREDVGYLERLSDPAVRRRLGKSTVRFAHHDRRNVVTYLEAWADLLEEDLGGPVAEPAVYLEAAE